MSNEGRLRDRRERASYKPVGSSAFSCFFTSLLHPHPHSSIMSDDLTRIAIVNSDKCKPKKCRQECKKSCPVVKMGKNASYPWAITSHAHNQQSRIYIPSNCVFNIHTDQLGVILQHHTMLTFSRPRCSPWKPTLHSRQLPITTRTTLAACMRSNLNHSPMTTTTTTIAYPCTRERVLARRLTRF